MNLPQSGFLLCGFSVLQTAFHTDTPIKRNTHEFPSTLLVLLVAAEHFYIAWLEMTQIPGEKAAETFKLPYELWNKSKCRPCSATKAV
ncbi:membrane protein [Neisseria gonorrhoeae]|uniref:Membrane protein n=1 Tax=Neisseria gonorrhoeae TaxID=485 RepID=A0A378W0Q3_NEIGO|nr:membrane protein [Neisseria gonorrhoeae]